MVRLSGIVLVVWAFITTCYAQSLPSMAIASEVAEAKEFVLKDLNITVRIHGPLAETSMTMVFFNPNGRALEGELNFPLPEGATVSGYALDVDGKMVDGVVVERTKARKVFEEIVRQGIDPGLVEKTRGNSFKTRVFPMPSKGSRTVRVSYVSELARTATNAVYHLPLTYNQSLASFSLRMEVYHPAAAPVVGDGDLSNFEFEEWHSGFFAETSGTDVTLSTDLRVAVPMSTDRAVFTERTPDGDVYFLIQDLKAVQKPDVASKQPRQITILWDSSASNGGHDHTREYNIIRNYVMGLASPVTVKLVEFNITATTVGTFKVGPDGCEPLIRAIKGLTYDGGTRLSALNDVVTAPRQPDLYLMFSDGLNTFGHDLTQQFTVPVYALCNTNTADHSRLKLLAIKSGGGYFNLKTHDDITVVPQLGKPVFCFLGATVPNKKDADYYPSVPVPVTNGFVMTGKLAPKTTRVTIAYGQSGATKEHRSFDVDSSEAVEGTLFQRYWAQSKINELILLDGKNVKEQITAIGKEFSIVTEGTSLMVLERLEQYIRYDIAPPKSLPKMRATYFSRKEAEAKQQAMSAAKTKQEQLKEAIAIWKAKVEWWNKTYTYKKIMPKKPNTRVINGNEVLEEVVVADVAEADGVALYGSALGGRVSAGRRRAVARYGGSSPGKAGGMGEEPHEPGMIVQPPKPELKLRIAEVKDKQAYLTRLEKLAPAEIYPSYLTLRKTYKTATAFYLDCADLLFRKGRHNEGLKALSTIGELTLDNHTLLRIVARKLEEIGELDLAIITYEQVKTLRPDEPQSLRDLALALEQRSVNTKDPAGADAVRAIKLMNEVVLTRWDRFAEIKPIVMVELNRLVARATSAGLKSHPVDSRLLTPMTPDIRVVMNWDEDSSDMDLWVTEPTKEKCYYGFNRTRIGGRLSHDITTGYGPEEYMIRKAIPGTYKVQVNYYGSRSAKLIGAVTLKLDIYRNYGTPKETRQTLIRRLSGPKDVIDICEFSLEGDPVDVVVPETVPAKKPPTPRGRPSDPNAGEW